VTLDVPTAVDRILLGESLASIAENHRSGLLREVGLDESEARPTTFAAETSSFMRTLCRTLGERHGDDRRVMIALRDWIDHRGAECYEAYDALLTHFDFEGKDALIHHGRMLFAGPMTAHWSS
jgi:hypothetical protein